MHSDPKIPLIGGASHGRTVQVDPQIQEVELDIHTSDEPNSEPAFTEKYTRRRFEGQGFGEGFECFALTADDDTEQKELARWSIGQSSHSVEDGKPE